MLALAESLTAEGWQVSFFVPESKRTQVEGVGATWCHYGTEDWDLYEGATRACTELGLEIPMEITPQKIMPFAVVPATLDIFPYLVSKMSELQPSFIAFDAAAPYGYLLAQHLGIPAVSSMSALPMPMDEREQESSKRSEPGKKLLDATCAALESRYALTFNHNYAYTCYSDYTIVWCSRYWHEQSADFPPQQFHYWGPLTSQRKGVAAGPGTDAVSQALSESSGRLVLCSLGTIATGDAFGKFGSAVVDFFHKLCRAAVLLEKEMPDVKLVVSAGKSADLVEEGGRVTHLFGEAVPGNVVVARSLDQLALLQKAEAFVTHCGQNSSSEAVLAGVPVVAMPFFGDQPLNAQRFIALGCGLLQSYVDVPPSASDKVFRPELDRVSPESLATAIRRVLDEPQFGETMRALREKEESGKSIDEKLQSYQSAYSISIEVRR
ncbi:ydhE [Symbiodinium pilosum]|uniref:YdhE protein n=1 Tax=Symbiodinium pilosum TaxID=2952 RepID=A0A812WN35_SYMPI|nr:ydhE [Symbiodinium pilosum]